jgi:biopolymer transport protein ExbD
MKRAEHPQVEMQIAPLIDVCFLLLFFYILTSKPVKPEGDIGVSLPGIVDQAESIRFPDEQRIRILETGAIVLNEAALDTPSSTDLPMLHALLCRYKESAQANKTQPLVTVDAADNSKHQRIIDVLNVCAQAGITQVTFAGVHDETP